MTTPSLNFAANTEVPVTMGPCECWVGPAIWKCAYKPGTDAEVDAAISLSGPAEEMLTQRKGEATSADQAFGALYAALGEAGVTVQMPQD